MGLGNVGSLCQCLLKLNKPFTIITEPDFSECSQLLFPGVGNFGKAAEILDQGWREPLVNWTTSGKSLLGICLGFQLLFEGSTESPKAKGLGLFDAQCEQVPSRKIPHMGWNQIQHCGEMSAEFDKAWMYFVHSYATPVIEETIFTAQDGSEKFSAAVWKEGVGGFQFHPEKSSEAGQVILNNFLERALETC